MSDQFPTTAWSCVREAGDPTHPTHVSAVNRLMASYWKPVFHFLRAKGKPTEDAEDLTQEFFTAFLVKGWIGRADPGKGQFRSFVKTLVARFAVARFDRAPNQQQHERGYVSVATLMTDADRQWEPTAGETPEDAFERSWRVSVLATVRRNLAIHYEAGDQTAKQRYAIFTAYHEPTGEQPTRQQLAMQFGITLEAVRWALDDVRKRYERLLRQEVRDQVGSEAEMDEELQKFL